MGNPSKQIMKAMPALQVGKGLEAVEGLNCLNKILKKQLLELPALYTLTKTRS
jgi:hypothetical protein